MVVEQVRSEARCVHRKEQVPRHQGLRGGLRASVEVSRDLPSADAAIYFVDRPFFGRRSCSVQFINVDGEAMFKVFVGRDESRNMRPEQLARFERLREKFATEPR